MVQQRETSADRHLWSQALRFTLRRISVQLESWFDQNPLSMGIGIPETCGIHPATFLPNCGAVIHFLDCLTLEMHGEFKTGLCT